ncbi:carbohydrate porin [Cyanobium sp. FGCU-52]|nr:carbohydrate porin [Cyanobium sp. FGCU52]
MIPRVCLRGLVLAGLGWLPALGWACAAAAEPLAAEQPEDFTPTTIVRSEVNAVMGALHYQGSAVDGSANTATGFPLLNAFSVNHEIRFTVDTSFTGQDLFRVRLRSGNFGPSGWFSNPPTPLTRLDVAFEEPLCAAGAQGCSRNLVSVNRAFLQVPLGAGVRLSAGSRIMQLDMLPVWPSVYNDAPILEVFQRAGAAGVYSRRVGSGFGLSWQPQGAWKGLSLAYATVAPRGDRGDPAEGGLYTAAGGQTSTLQLGYTQPNWNLTAAYTRTAQGALLRGTPLASQLAAESRGGGIGSWSLAGYWQPAAAGWLPSISAGLGHDRFAFRTYPVAGVSGVRTTSWYVGLGWSDLFGPGSSLSLAVGAPTHVSRIEGLDPRAIDDSGLAFELATLIRLSDTFSLTPAVFWLSRPRGAMAGTSSLDEALLPGQGDGVPSLSAWGALVRATFRF